MNKRIVIEGGKQLFGEVSISGAKNAVLKLMAAALLIEDVCLIHNVPDLSDVETMVSLINCLGAKTKYSKLNQTIEIDARDINNCVADYAYVSKMRASFDVLGALLSRLGEAKVALPGGCAIGERRVDLHIKGLQLLGADVAIENGYVLANGNKLKGVDISLSMPSVGATENIMLASIFAEGVTRIQNAAQEPEIVDLANFLNMAGADITGAGTSEITINGVQRGSLKGIQYSTIPASIEAASYMCAVCAVGGEIIGDDIIPSHLTFFLNKMQEIGVKIEPITPYSLKVKKDKRLKAIDLITQPYPGFHTDMQAPVMSVLALADGTSIITESLFENRFMQVPELRRMGADIQQENSKAIIKGVEYLTGAEVKASDLRAGAAMVVAALAANGTSTISDIHHIDRGYEKLEEKFSNLGANIKRVENFENISDNKTIESKVLL
ncbi:MAG: UDP-N-acetylglucosamine 1-carboxyvinyltransferase [Candidatus Gastranaerophilales bacterium]|nr:UDP-N-acetylglucosamine 1-carboxyvinyltransferase [Candidatus Gastranaerophilales bacterium]